MHMYLHHVRRICVLLAALQPAAIESASFRVHDTKRNVHPTLHTYVFASTIPAHANVRSRGPDGEAAAGSYKAHMAEVWSKGAPRLF